MTYEAKIEVLRALLTARKALGKQATYCPPTLLPGLNAALGGIEAQIQGMGVSIGTAERTVAEYDAGRACLKCGRPKNPRYPDCEACYRGDAVACEWCQGPLDLASVMIGGSPCCADCSGTAYEETRTDREAARADRAERRCNEGGDCADCRGR